jgi:multiphosphoryl transfer protein
MRVEYRFTCGLRHGLHARPASMLAETAGRFSSQLTLASAREGAGVDLRSVLSVVGLDVKPGEVCVIVAAGPDAEAAIEALRLLVESELGREDERSPPIEAGPPGPSLRLPIGLRRLGVAATAGRTACGGIGQGAAVLVSGLMLPPSLCAARAGPVEEELDAAHRAVGAVRSDLDLRRRRATDPTERDLLGAHAQIAADPALWAEVEAGILAGNTAAQSVAGAGECCSQRLRAARSQYIRERVVDVHDVCMQIVERLAGASVAEVRLNVDSVVFADVLTPNQLLRMDRRLLRGMVLGAVGATSHTVILARSFRIPTLCDVAEVGSLAVPGAPTIVDGEAGFVIAPAAAPVQRYYEREQRTQSRWRERMRPLARTPARTRDAFLLEVGANASSAEEVAAAVEHGADGVGLLRTEVLFLDRDSAPGEEEQFRAYSAVVAAASGRPVIIRTFDIGGDKPAGYLRMPREDNPFLGVRGLRLYEHHPVLLRTQLRAIARASALGPVKVMAPMVAAVAEAEWFRDQVRAVQADLLATGVAFDDKMPIGVMIEIPAAAFGIDQLSEVVEFFSIGTNDLCQYFIAVDRGNPGVTGLYNARHPAFLRLLRMIVDGAKAGGRWVGVCGEMASERRNLPLMIGLGLDEISVAPGEAMVLKAMVREADAGKCRELLGDAAECRDAEGVDQLLASGSWRDSAPNGRAVLAVELVEVGSEALTKEEAIKEAVDLLYIAGRTDRPRDLEEAVWAREETYSTALGFGFAVPHCRSEAVDAPTLAVLKLCSEIAWGSSDGGPVRMVILLAVPVSEAAGSHMKVFAKLARRLMHEEFRDRLIASNDPVSIVEFLRAELGLGGSA